MYPMSLPVETLTASGVGNDEADIKRSLFNMLLAGLATVSTLPVVASEEVGEVPRATPLARADANEGKDWTTNVRHEPVPLSLIARAVIPLLDGTRDRASIKNSVNNLVQQGKIRFEREGAALQDPALIAAAVDEHVATVLSALQRTGLLMP